MRRAPSRPPRARRRDSFNCPCPPPPPPGLFATLEPPAAPPVLAALVLFLWKLFELLGLLLLLLSYALVSLAGAPPLASDETVAIPLLGTVGLYVLYTLVLLRQLWQVRAARAAHAARAARAARAAPAAPAARAADGHPCCRRPPTASDRWRKRGRLLARPVALGPPRGRCWEAAPACNEGGHQHAMRGVISMRRFGPASGPLLGGSCWDGFGRSPPALASDERLGRAPRSSLRALEALSADWHPHRIRHRIWPPLSVCHVPWFCPGAPHPRALPAAAHAARDCDARLGHAAVRFLLLPPAGACDAIATGGHAWPPSEGLRAPPDRPPERPPAERLPGCV